MKTISKKQRGKLYRKFADRMERGINYYEAIKSHADARCGNDLNCNIFVEANLFPMSYRDWEEISNNEIRHLRIIALYLAAEICNA